MSQITNEIEIVKVNSSKINDVDFLSEMFSLIICLYVSLEKDPGKNQL